jgi:hypothetical protein
MIEDVTQLSPIEHLTILALLNIKDVPRNVVYAVRANFKETDNAWDLLSAKLD